MEYYKKVLSHYADFTGRARRKEYWMFALFNIIALIVAGMLDNLLGLTFVENIPYGFIYTIYALAVFIPGLAVTVRRLHDIGKSGWMYLIILIPLVGAVWLLVLLVSEGGHGANQYGEDPKAAERSF
ncbi:DUF805 domain-containing protein [Echinicola rosea]|uniref:Aminopeptidase n=1 Tax=Echinicola rosea TaxID=1807691 RepID=A0ABQ1V3M2_9BACT|nr:DUF805 domain-containing protein [Echinicola rosea]GGF34925.1 aminopeptidase [Echinicola rosea]